MADEAGKGAQSARAAVGHGTVSGPRQHAVRSERPASAVGRSDGLGADD